MRAIGALIATLVLLSVVWAGYAALVTAQEGADSEAEEDLAAAR